MTGSKRTKVTGRHRSHRPGRPAPPALVAPAGGRPGTAAASLLALCLAAVAGGVAGCGAGAPSATVLRGAAGVTVTAADGSSHPGVDGERIATGETVRTSTTRAALVTGGRVATLGPDSALGLAGGDRLRLDGGTVVVDHRHGPDASVVAGPVTVGSLGRTAVRVERGFSVRVAVYDGGSARATADERSITVPALHELAVPGASLPAGTAPLALRDDALDALASPDLVAADVAIVARAAGIDAPAAASALAAVRTAVLHGLPTAAAAVADPARPLSERVLPVAIARADPHAPAAAAYAQAASLRAQGGSWGVVAALLGAPLGDVQQQLTALLDAPAEIAALTPLGPDTGATSDGLALLLANAAGGSRGSGDTPSGGTSAGGSRPSSRPTTPTPAGPTATPTPTPTSLVGALLGTVTGLLPGPSTTAPAPTPTTPRASPTPSSGLLGGVLGGLLGGG